MIKNLLRILASSATLVAMMLVANIAVARPDSAIAFESVDSVATTVNLNVMSSSLQSTHANTLLDSLGCSCPACVEGAIPSTALFESEIL